MAQSDTDDLFNAIAPHLPFLRRFARALTGSQVSGDEYAAATLEAIIEDSSIFVSSRDSRVALFRVFYAIWSSSGARIVDALDAEGSFAAKAQANLRGLAPNTRVAFLLKCLENFDNAAVAEIMQIPVEEAAELIEIGREDLARQVAGRVLIIEDEPIIAMDLEAIVADLGHTVAAITDTRDTAVTAAMAERPNLVLADIQLADGSSGVDAVNDILTAFSVPVIFITAYPERLLTGTRPEPTFLITKPFKEDQVRAAIGQALFFETVIDAI
jgi:CheY-like chemotaxis protein